MTFKSKIRIKIKGPNPEKVMGNLVSVKSRTRAGQLAMASLDKAVEKYPPAPPSSRPPRPYYKRGRGYQPVSGPNKGNSENMKQRWVTTVTAAKVTKENKASYARYVIGRKGITGGQNPAMARIGWLAVPNYVDSQVRNITKQFVKGLTS